MNVGEAKSDDCPRVVFIKPDTAGGLVHFFSTLSFELRDVVSKSILLRKAGNGFGSVNSVARSAG